MSSPRRARIGETLRNLPTRHLGALSPIPTGLPHRSPGLVRRAPTLGPHPANFPNPERVASPPRHTARTKTIQPFQGWTKFPAHEPRVAPASQPWAWVRQPRWGWEGARFVGITGVVERRCPRRAAPESDGPLELARASPRRALPNPNGIASPKPRVGAPSTYPGSASRKFPQP